MLVKSKRFRNYSNLPRSLFIKVEYLSRGSGDSKTFEKEQFIEIELALSTRCAPSIVINGVVGAAINGRK